MPPLQPVKKLLDQRQTTHGNFEDNARISQQLKITAETPAFCRNATHVQREALHMICLKLSRIASGQPNEADHWADIAGYAQLAVRELEES